MDEVKKCKRCKQEKTIDKFYSEFRCQSCKDYYDNYYKEHRQQEIDRSKRCLNKDRDKTNAYKRSLYRKSPLKSCLIQAKVRAKKIGVPFDITLDDLDESGVCPILGIPLKINKGTCAFDSYTIDRIIPELGYVKGNVAVISFKANTIKNNASVEDLEKILSWLKEKLKIIT